MLNEGVGSWLERRVKKSAQHPAIIFHDEQISYQRLSEGANRLCAVLRSWGVTKGSRIAYLGENHPSFVEVFFATTQLGGIFVPLNTRLTPLEHNFVLNDSGATVLVVSESLAAEAERAIIGTTVEHMIVASDLPELQRSGSTDFHDTQILLSDPAALMYTSGTTGRPKGAVLTHGNLIWNSVNVLVDYDLVSSDRALMISPMFHAASFGMGVLPSLLKGATLILESGFEPARALELIQRYQVTLMSGVPTTYQMLCEHDDWENTDLSSLQKLTCGGSPVPMRVIEAFEARGLSFTGGYGMTETAPGATSLQPEFSISKAGSAGLPHFFTSVRVADKLGALLPAQHIGEIQISGPNVIREYWNNADATHESFTDDGWFRSGDLGFFDEEGFLFVSDRIKDMIISGGENIFPAEIEAVLMRSDEIAACAVIGVPDEKWGEAPVAVITLAGENFDVNNAQLELYEHLARYKVPKRFVIISEMPRTASGKIKKNELRSFVKTLRLDAPVSDLRGAI